MQGLLLPKTQRMTTFNELPMCFSTGASVLHSDTFTRIQSWVWSGG
jgi:hypothetical protein